VPCGSGDLDALGTACEEVPQDGTTFRTIKLIGDETEQLVRPRMLSVTHPTDRRLNLPGVAQAPT